MSNYMISSHAWAVYYLPSMKHVNLDGMLRKFYTNLIE